jgi:hypothetical protein
MVSIWLVDGSRVQMEASVHHANDVAANCYHSSNQVDGLVRGEVCDDVSATGVAGATIAQDVVALVECWLHGAGGQHERPRPTGPNHIQEGGLTVRCNHEQGQEKWPTNPS